MWILKIKSIRTRGPCWERWRDCVTIEIKSKEGIICLTLDRACCMELKQFLPVLLAMKWPFASSKHGIQGQSGKLYDWVEWLHATHHHKNDAGAHVLDYAWSFGDTVKEGRKQTATWSTYCFTNKKSYYPNPTNSSRFWNIPLLLPLPAVAMSDVHQDFMRELAKYNGKTMRQKNC